MLFSEIESNNFTWNCQSKQSGALHSCVNICHLYLEKPECLVGPQPHQALHVQGLQGAQRLADAADPAGHLARRVDVVWLHVLGEPLLHKLMN